MKKLSKILVCSSFLVTGFIGVQNTANASTEVTPSPTNSTNIEVAPLAIFVPDRCIYPTAVTKAGSGWYVTVGMGTVYFLDSAAKEGWRNPSVGAEIEIMMSAGIVAGWRVTGN